MFRTELPLTPHPQQLPLSARVLTVGSCFSDTIGSRLAATKVKTLINPFGTVFNPVSACQLLRAAAGEDKDWQQHVVEARGRWQSYDLHATVGADSPVTLLQRIQGLVQEVGAFLQNTDVVVLTLGTAFAYRLLETDEIVNNCHKVPAERFEKVLLTPDEIINAVAETHAYLRRTNPTLRFILTVSPVRHVKDTLPLNSVSKSVLRVACHYLSELLPDVSYFPAYELLLDDLRDYRFYAADMLHPSEVAENYIWERFTRTYFDPGFGRFRREWESVRQALGHRPLYPEAPEHREFLAATLARVQRLAAQADVRSEIQELERQLAALPLPQPKPEPEPELDDDEERIDIGEPDPEKERTPVEVAAPTVTPATAVTVTSPVEEAAQEEDQYEAEDDEEGETALEASAALPKKKRRSRGGAKRTARKRAAQLQAQLAAEAAAGASNAETDLTAQQEPEATVAFEAEVPEEPQSSPAPTPAEAPVAEAVPESVAPERVHAVVQPAEQPLAPVLPTPKPNVDWLQPMDEPEETPAPKQRSLKAARGKSTRVETEKKPRATKDRIITTPPSTSRRKRPALYAEPTEATEPTPVEPVIPLEAEPRNTVPTPPVSADPVAVEAASPVEVVVPEPVSEPAPAAEKKPRKPRARPAAKPKEPKADAPKPEETAPEAPKKRSRPSRKKPAATDETPSAS
ncbi:GSCFA domain-containing protein [Hymenobacter metallicola]|uniref:GSCFA domain-containing protein n=1 Tax=Hymenobacter metallicola TaxID=2563114 RepID=A0A4Z0PZ15_9BACT|nr:GSCFA domain-containing protein [Hymenobacter metallicola]TGE23008.1 hypothetical protein E5K02_21880 [Hymenobacter metallicola]